MADGQPIASASGAEAAARDHHSSSMRRWRHCSRCSRWSGVCGYCWLHCPMLMRRRHR